MVKIVLYINNQLKSQNKNEDLKEYPQIGLKQNKTSNLDVCRILEKT